MGWRLLVHPAAPLRHCFAAYDEPAMAGMPLSGAVNLRSPWGASTSGAPQRMNRNDGRKVKNDGARPHLFDRRKNSSRQSRDLRSDRGARRYPSAGAKGRPCVACVTCGIGRALAASHQREGGDQPAEAVAHLLQRQLLEDEGIVFDEHGRVNFKRFRWRP